jgi:hypothetical protein
VDYDDLRDAYDRAEDRLESLRRLEYAEYAVYGVPAAVFGLLTGFLLFSGADTGETGKMEEGFKPNLTDYQQSYVDCPHKHIYICTRMSRLGTEPVSFVRTEDSRIFLKYSRSDRLVARMPENGTTGYLINIDRNYYVNQETNEPSETNNAVEDSTTDETNATSVGGATENPNATQQTSPDTETLTGQNQSASNSTQTS